MPRTLSANLRSAINAQETGEAVLFLLKLEHGSIGAPILVVNDGQSVTSRGNVYQAFPFEIALPEDSDEASPSVTLRICNVDRTIVDAVRRLTGEMTVVLEVILASSPETVEAGPYTFVLKRCEYNALVVEGELAYEDILNEPYPGDLFNSIDFPGLA